MKSLKLLAIACLLSIVTACANNQAQSNYYKASSANVQMESEIVEILLISKAMVEVDNSENQKKATQLGAIGGALLGIAAVKNDRTSGGVAGGLVGGVAGNAVGGTKVVDGVSITYKIGVKTFTAVQAGLACQFVTGNALLVKGEDTNARIQPNSECPIPTEG